ncbi:MAG: PAC2 family protein [Actinomycetota bacterium]|nr:PAC2 family protein [Actinomycetota bacterium]
MELVDWLETPDVSNSVMIAAFTGWNDAGDAASEATRYLARRYEGRRVAEIDPELFYDFASVRPSVRLDGDEREIDWPSNQVRLAELDDGRSLVTVLGIEPRLRWRTFSDSVIEIARKLDVSTVITLGALLTDTHHQAPIDVMGTSNNDVINIELGTTPSSYEGPTGIIGVLNDAFHRSGFDSLSFWAAVPSYIGHSPSPKAALALVQKVVEFLDIPLGATDLQIAAASYDRQVDELVESDPSLAEYAQQILDDEAEEAAEEISEMAENPEALMDELEQFLRQQEE